MIIYIMDMDSVVVTRMVQRNIKYVPVDAVQHIPSMGAIVLSSTFICMCFLV